MRKFLEKIGVTDTPDIWDGKREHRRRWKKQRKKYGFDERETWSLDYTFCLWLYERVKMYYKRASEYVDLEFRNDFKYKGNTYNQKQLIKLLMKKLEKYLTADNPIFETEVLIEIGEIWAVLLPYMSW